ncbi:hypothetical protein EDB81DRAFT_846505 [Dactylonectria macrodidyma]|uniref:Negative regulator of differentiation 1 n=1 Tax=Dactylonectria macrodidyma TaxID=307937 RepID=A0A9P9DWB7_9HYPO|nr:hypothetical protein EDB81DRAFT_846505 [Dactylonectria macrodidyma]
MPQMSSATLCAISPGETLSNFWRRDRAQLLSEAQDLGLGVICISQAEYDDLLEVARQHTRLRQSLLRGGIDEDTIGVQPPPEELRPTAPGWNRAPTGPFEQSSKPSSLNTPRYVSRSYLGPSIEHQDGGSWDEVDSVSESASMSIDSSTGGVPVDRLATRTIFLYNLTEGVTHSDITTAIRGGQLLDVFLRHRDRTASVSFVYGEDAKAFYARARHHDLYIKNRKVELRWADRQFTVPSHVAHKITVGATRNLVIHNCDPNHTEESIRDDLEHIHNLVVIHIDFVRGDCFISTNSIHNAMFARTCMMSRVKYRGSRIQWAADECAQPLAQVQVSRRNSTLAAKTQPTNRMANRFQLLNLGNETGYGGENDADSDSSDDTLH